MKINKRVMGIGILFVGITLGSITTLLIPKGLADTSISNTPVSGDNAVQVIAPESTNTSVSVPSPAEQTVVPTPVPTSVPAIVNQTQAPQTSNTQTPSPCVR